MNRLIHFEIQAGDPERAAKFYRELFGWDIKEWVIPGVSMKDENRYWLMTTGPESEPGINGGIVFRRGPAPAQDQTANAYVCTVGVADIDKAVSKAKKAGGSITLPRMPVRGVGWVAYCKDTEGNSFCMMQEDKSAR